MRSIMLHGTVEEDHSRYRGYWEEMPCYLSVHDRQFRIVDVADQPIERSLGRRARHHVAPGWARATTCISPSR